MTHEEQNLAVAELHGFTNIRISISWEMWDTPPSHRLVGMLDGFLREVPEYTEDLNACQDVVSSLSQEHRTLFVSTLRGMFFPDTTGEETLEELRTYHEDASRKATLASARQRVEALLRTAGKWRETT